MKPFPLLLLVFATLSLGACASGSAGLRPTHDLHAGSIRVDAAIAISASTGAAGSGEPFSPEDDTSTTADGSARTTADASSPATAHAAAGTETTITVIDPVADASAPGALSDANELSAAEQDAATLYADVVVSDPWERYNRRISLFNNVVDRYVLRPLAVGYTRVAPRPVRSCVSRVLDNLGTPATTVHQLLQGRPGHALQSLGRFAVNTTIGIGGVFDPATRLGMPRRGDEDFGQTLAVWGWRDSRYLVLPLFGPRTLRDAFAMAGDRLLSPAGRIADTRVAASLQLLEVVDGRTRLLPIDDDRRQAFDEYALVRDAWAQHRRYQIERDRQDHRD